MPSKKTSKYDLLKLMCHIPAPSGNEVAMKQFLLYYIKTYSSTWQTKPKIFQGEGFQDNLVLVFGKPRVAIFSHMDNVGFTVRYGKQLVKIGGPETKDGYDLIGYDSKGLQEVKLKVPDKRGEKPEYEGERNFETGTELCFRGNWRETKDYVQCCYMDNRVGIYNALKVAETIKNGVIAFSTYEEHGGGSVQYLQRFLHKKYGILQALISDVSWISDGVRPGKGPVISMRDSLIPRRSYVKRIIDIAKKNKCAFQIEVEGSGGSDAGALQMAENAWDWCFVGAAEENVHSPDEKVYKKDIESMIKLYTVLMREL